MSDEKKLGENAGFHPAKPTKLTVEELIALKKLFAEHPLIRWAVYLAGFGGLLDGLRVVWEVVRHFAK